MTRNAGKVYLTVGIPRDSQLYTRLVNDAQEAGIPLSKLIVVRMMDWYGLSVSGQVAEGEERKVVPRASSPSVMQAQEQATSQHMRENAMQALSSWSG